jgi:hypothetical protein
MMVCLRQVVRMGDGLNWFIIMINSKVIINSITTGLVIYQLYWSNSKLEYSQ